MILAIDQGTTGTTCLVINQSAQVNGRAYSEFTQHYPQPGWVEYASPAYSSDGLGVYCLCDLERD